MKIDEINWHDRPDLESLVLSFEECKELNLGVNTHFYWAERVRGGEITLVVISKDKLYYDYCLYSYNRDWYYENIYPAPLKC